MRSVDSVFYMALIKGKNSMKNFTGLLLKKYKNKQDSG